MKNYIYLSTLILLFTACKAGGENLSNKTTDKTNFISCIKPFKDLEIKPNVFEIDTKEKAIISLKNGGRIEFPANAFVDLNGKQITGKVDVEWKEYHSLTDIILSGIPMKYDSAGVENDFVSGGMFTLNAKQDGKELALAPGKKATVDLASMQDTPCYNFYKLNEKSGDWAYKATKAGTPNPNFKEKEEVKVKEEKFQLIDAQLNTSAFPELESQHIVAWKTKDKVNKTVFSKITRSAKLMASEKANEYLLEVSDKNNVYVYHVQPYTLEEAKKNSKKVDAILEKDFSEELKFQNDVMTGKIIRSIEIESLGTYNWDAILHIQNHTTVTADLDLPNKIKKASLALFFICPTLNATIRVKTDEENPVIRFDPKSNFTLIGILPDNSVVTIQKEDLTALKKSPSRKKVKLSFKKTGKRIRVGADLQQFITENL